MKKCHEDLEKFRFQKQNIENFRNKVGTEPHYKYIKHDYDEYLILETSEDIKAKDYKNPKVSITYYDGKKIPFDDEYFDRIIISHCLEHILEPEKFLFEMMSKLKKGGVLSISLPSDPGLLFRLGRLYLKIFSIQKKY